MMLTKHLHSANISLLFLPVRKRGNSYGNVSRWLGVRHTPVLYQNG